MKIRGKIILGFVIAALIYATVSFAFVYINARQETLGLIGGYNTLLAKGHIEAIDRIIYRRLEVWRSYMFFNEGLSAFLKKHNEEFDLMENRDEYIRIQDSDWRTMPANQINALMSEILENQISKNLNNRLDFYEKEYGYQVFSEVFITNKYGVNAVQTQRTSDYYQADEEWWQKAKEDGVFISDIVYDESSEIYALELCFRVDDQQGNFLGVVKVIYDVRDVFGVVDNIIESDSEIVNLQINRESLDAFLVDKNDRLIYSVKSGFGKLADQSDLLAIFSEKDDHDHLSYVVIEDDGVKKFFSHFHSLGYRDFSGLGWRLITSKEASEVLEPVDKVAWFLFLGSAMALAVALLFGFIISFFFTKPIKKMEEVAKDIAGGNLDRRIEKLGRDEIGELALSFNKMADRLSKNIANIEQKVSERTDQLNKINQSMVGRELKMIELKKEIKELKSKKK